jgi:hypothetical protein
MKNFTFQGIFLQEKAQKAIRQKEDNSHSDKVSGKFSWRCESIYVRIGTRSLI